MGDDFELMLASVDRSISQLRAMRPVALRGPTKFQVSSGSALRKMISRRTFAKCVGSLLAVGLPKVGLAQAIIKTNVAAVNGSTPGLHTNSYSALCSISAITHSYTAGTALSMRGNPDLPIAPSPEEASDTQAAAATFTDPMGDEFSCTGVQSEGRKSDVAGSFPEGNHDFRTEFSINDAYSDFFSLTALGLEACHKANFAQPVDAAGSLISLYGNVREAERSPSGVLGVAAKTGIDVTTGLAARALGIAVFEVAAVFVPTPLAVAYGVGAGLTVLLGSHFATSYLTHVTKDVFSSLEMTIGSEQAKTESALQDFYRLPIVGGGF